MVRRLGIDLGGTSVRVALLESRFRKTVLLALREERFLDHATVPDALRAATATLRADACATSVDGRKCFMRRIELPKAALKDLANVLSFEVEATLPFELDDAVMDHRRLRAVPGVDSPNEISIFAGVAVAEAVRDRIHLVRRGLGMEPERVGLGPLPLANLALILPEFATGTPRALLDLGDDTAELIVLRHGEPRFARTLSCGASMLPADAGRLARELKQTLLAWRSSGGDALNSLTVVGTGRSVPGLDEFLRQSLDVAVLDLPPLGLDGVAAHDRALVPRFAKAIGLALGCSRRPADLNLRQGTLEAQQSYQFLREKTPLLAGLGAALAVSFGFSVFGELRSLGAERAALEEQLHAATRTHFGKPTRDAKGALDLIDAAIAGNFDDPMPDIDGFDVVVALSERIPSGLVHDIAELDFNRGAVSIKGVVGTIDDAQKVAAAIDEHACFSDVNLTRTTRLKDQDKQKYTLEFKADCSPSAKKGDKQRAQRPAPKQEEE
ncbi:MAG: general secretion pathway protein GspL [Myxococcales bacterium]|nr:general secretion pathway protein GspL [Myxococcales bacterium]